MKKSIILASLFAASTFVSAEESITLEGVIPEAVEASFQSMDANQDGLISIEEAEVNEKLLEAFVDLDLDKTADLTKAEFSKFAAISEK